MKPSDKINANIDKKSIPKSTLTKIGTSPHIAVVGNKKLKK